jgi:pentatricopeptide repeat protein
MRDKAQRSHAVLERMKKMQAEGKHSCRPDSVTYNTVMNAYAKSKEADAPLKVEALLREMHQLYETSGDRFQKPSCFLVVGISSTKTLFSFPIATQRDQCSRKVKTSWKGKDYNTDIETNGARGASTAYNHIQ